MTPPEHDDPLADLRARILETREAAERLAGDAAFARASSEPGGRGPGPWGQGPSDEDRERRTSEVQSLVALLESLKDLIPDDLREQFRELTRQVLLLARALIDWWVERMDAPTTAGRDGRGPVVEDIPIA